MHQSYNSNYESNKITDSVMNISASNLEGNLPDCHGTATVKIFSPSTNLQLSQSTHGSRGKKQRSTQMVEKAQSDNICDSNNPRPSRFPTHEEMKDLVQKLLDDCRGSKKQDTRKHPLCPGDNLSYGNGRPEPVPLEKHTQRIDRDRNLFVPTRRHSDGTKMQHPLTESRSSNSGKLDSSSTPVGQSRRINKIPPEKLHQTYKERKNHVLTHQQIASESENCHSQYRSSTLRPKSPNATDSPTARSIKTGQISSGNYNQANDGRNPVLPLDSPMDRDKRHHSQMKATSTDIEKLYNMDSLLVPTSCAEQVIAETSYQSNNRARNPMVHYGKAVNKPMGHHPKSGASPYKTIKPNATNVPCSSNEQICTQEVFNNNNKGKDSALLARRTSPKTSRHCTQTESRVSRTNWHGRGVTSFKGCSPSSGAIPKHRSYYSNKQHLHVPDVKKTKKDNPNGKPFLGAGRASQKHPIGI